MNDDWIEDELRRSLRPTRPRALPAFEDTLQAAGYRLAGERSAPMLRGFVAVAAVLIGVAAVLHFTGEEQSLDLRIDEALLTGTQWTAPSDALMPIHEFDIYRDVPALPGSTGSEEGTFL